MAWIGTGCAPALITMVPRGFGLVDRRCAAMTAPPRRAEARTCGAPGAGPDQRRRSGSAGAGSRPGTGFSGGLAFEWMHSRAWPMSPKPSPQPLSDKSVILCAPAVEGSVRGDRHGCLTGRAGRPRRLGRLQELHPLEDQSRLGIRHDDVGLRLGNRRPCRRDRKGTALELGTDQTRSTDHTCAVLRKHAAYRSQARTAYRRVPTDRFRIGHHPKLTKRDSCMSRLGVAWRTRRVITEVRREAIHC